MSKCLGCGCSDFDKCLSVLNLMLDNEATPEQEAFFLDHIQNCMVCFAHCNSEKQIRQLIRSKLNNKTVPQSLVDEIRKRTVR